MTVPLSEAIWAFLIFVVGFPAYCIFLIWGIRKLADHNFDSIYGKGASDIMHGKGPEKFRKNAGAVMTTISPNYTGISCNGCKEVYEDTNGWSVSTPGVMWDSAYDNGWVDTDDDQHWCPSCQSEGKVLDDGGHKLEIEGGYTFCARCEEEWPCPPFRTMHPNGEA